MATGLLAAHGRDLSNRTAATVVWSWSCLSLVDSFRWPASLRHENRNRSGDRGDVSAGLSFLGESSYETQRSLPINERLDARGVSRVGALSAPCHAAVLPSTRGGPYTGRMSAEDALPSQAPDHFGRSLTSLAEVFQEKFSNQQRALLQALSEVGRPPAGDRLAACYLGALSALGNSNNPERLPQAGHSLREMMDMIPVAIELPGEALRERLGNEAAKLETQWNAAQGSACLQDGEWSGSIDQRLKRFLDAAKRFYSWKAKHQPRRRIEFDTVLAELDASGHPPPGVLRELNVQAWMKMHDYFVAVAHHGEGVDSGEFESWLDALEKTILNLLVPRTFEGFDEIDAILEDDEIDA